MANRNFPQSRQWSNHMMPVSYDCNIAIGSTGAPTISATNGYGIHSITRLAQGQYRLQLQDNFAKLLQFKCAVESPTTGGSIAAGSLNVGTVYKITALGTTTQAQWVTAGVPIGITAAVGVTFLCAATTSGNGTAKALGSSGITTTELLTSYTGMLNNRPNGTQVQNQGGFIDFQTMGLTVTIGAITPAGTNSAPALTMNSYTPAGTNNSSTPPIFTGTPATLTGSVAAPTFTGTPVTPTGTVSMVATDPLSGSRLIIEAVVSNSSVQ